MDPFDESILGQVKIQLGISKSNPVFDNDLIPRINTVLTELNQFGIGPKEEFRIVDDNPTWNDFWENSQYNTKTNMAIDYMYYRVKLEFDPPASSFLLASLQSLRDETANRLTYINDEARLGGK